jgi:hypothetical protein
MTKHHFHNDPGFVDLLRQPGQPREFRCACGMRGSHDAVAQHVAAHDDLRIPQENEDLDDQTVQHYLPIEPRGPAVPEPLPPPPFVATRTIAESFQDMLRQAFAAGVAAATSGEAFESWYQREILR